VAYTGAWKQSTNFYYDPIRGKVHTADRRHADVAERDPVAFVYAAPLGLDYVDQDVPEYPGMEWVTDEPGRVGDQTPVTHIGGDTGPTYATEQGMQEDSQRRHAVDYGASREGNYGEPIFRMATEQNHMITRDGAAPESPTVINPVALQRGLNGLPENNPDGWRAGHIEWWRPDRKFYEGWRTTDARPLVPNVAQLATDTPPVPTQFGNPFNSLARAMTMVNQRPMIRRDPTPISENITTDGTYGANAYVSDWVVG